MRFRKPLKITSRTSSITNSFVQAIIPSIEPTAAQIDEAFAVLGMSANDPRCVYCGASATDWDHLRPLVSKKRPTGYISEIRNLVPSCGSCNQSKGGSDWRAWIAGRAKNSPTSRGVRDVARRVRRLERFESWGQVEKVELAELAGRDKWDAYWQNLEIIEKQMQEAQGHADRIRATIRAAMKEWTNAPVTFPDAEPSSQLGN